MDNNKEIILSDLGEMVEDIRKRIKEDFHKEDFRVSKGFQEAFRNNISESGNSVDYLRTSAIITNTSGQKIYAPNQWFVLASYAVDFVKEIQKYRNFSEAIIDTNIDRLTESFDGGSEKKEIYKGLKVSENNDLQKVFREIAYDFFSSQNMVESDCAKNTDMLCRFVTDDRWWLGGKGIERSNDYYVSPVLGSLNLVNASQSYVATITYLYVNDINLYNELDTIIDNEEEDDDMEVFTPFVDPVYKTKIVSRFDRNRIVFGAPGTGKSYRLKNDCEELLGKNAKDFERVTFHPDYSYSQFVGAYKPVSDKKKEIRYDFVPGPFMRIYVEAIKNGKSGNPQPYLLLIEEINRANVAAVFGDVFQLLDRDDDNVSEYSIQATEDVKKYLAKKLGGKPTDYSEIKLPDNMFIWASMNSADQGVFPMDTAFKRRWSFTYLGIDDSEKGIEGKMVTLGKGDYEKKIEWNALRKAINDELLRYKVNEDKLMGPYFVSKKVVPEAGEIDKEKFIEVFKSKVIMYLFDDAAKQKRLTLFEGCEEKSRNQYSKICKEFETKGISIFCENISSRFVKDSGEA